MTDLLSAIALIALGVALHAATEHLLIQRRKKNKLKAELTELQENSAEMSRKVAEKIQRLADAARQEPSDAARLREEVESNARRYCPPGTKYFVWRTDREWKC